MKKLTQAENVYLNRVGEFGTLSELLKRNLDVHITIGNTKTMDIQVMYPDSTWKSIDVKTYATNGLSPTTGRSILTRPRYIRITGSSSGSTRTKSPTIIF